MNIEKKIHYIFSLISTFLIIVSYWLYMEGSGEDKLYILPIMVGFISVGVARIVIYFKKEGFKLYRLQEIINIPIIIYTLFLHGTPEQEMFEGKHLLLLVLLLNFVWFFYGKFKL